MRRFFPLLNNDRDRQIRPILAQLIWRQETAAPPVPCGLDLSYAVMFMEGVLSGVEREYFLDHMSDCRYCRLFVAREMKGQRPGERAHRAGLSPRRYVIPLRWWTAAAAACLIGAVAIWQVWSGGFTTRETQAIMSSLHPGESHVPALNEAPAAPALTTSALRRRVGRVSKRLAGYKNLVGAVAQNQGIEIPPTVRRLFRVDAATEVPSEIAIASTPNRESNRASVENQTDEYTVQVQPLRFIAADTSQRQSPEFRVAVLSSGTPQVEQPSIQLPQRQLMPKDLRSEIRIIPRPSSLGGLALSFQSRNSGFDGGSVRRSAGSQLVSIGGKRFRRVDRVLIDTELTSTVGRPIVKVRRQSAEMRNLMKERPGLQPFFQVNRDIVVLYEGTVYLTY